jgi:hypothetical protein
MHALREGRFRGVQRLWATDGLAARPTRFPRCCPTLTTQFQFEFHLSGVPAQSADTDNHDGVTLACQSNSAAKPRRCSLAEVPDNLSV